MQFTGQLWTPSPEWLALSELEKYERLGVVGQAIFDTDVTFYYKRKY